MKIFILCGGFGTRLDHEGKLKAKPMVKIGIIFLLIGMLILIFKELIIVLIASVFIVIGIFMFYLAFSIWNRTKNY